MRHRLELTVSILFALTAVLLTGCRTSGHLSIEVLKDPPCRTASGLAWAGPHASEQRERLSNWCQSVGPALIHLPDLPLVDIAESGLTVLTWNKHEGYGDLRQLLLSLDRRQAIVILLQEVARFSESVPRNAPLSFVFPGRIGPKETDDIAAIATEFNMSLAYVPSMPNGARTQEDRGCAILSTLPLSEAMGIELPWVSQRRVAVMATLSGIINAQPWRLRVMSVHLDNRLQRSQQAAALADFLMRLEPSGAPALIGGDLNAWWGTRDRAVREIDRVVPLVRECDHTATFRFGPFPFRLDHLFTTLPGTLRNGCSVTPNRFGSDHHPIMLRLFKTVQK